MGVSVTIELDEAEVITLNEWKPDITAHRYHDVFIGTILAKRVKDALPRPIRVGDKVLPKLIEEDGVERIVRHVEGDEVCYWHTARCKLYTLHVSNVVLVS